MKKYNLLLKAFVAIVAMLSGECPAFAYHFKVDGIYYNIITDSTNKNVRVTSGAEKYSGAVSIPSSVTYNGLNFSVTSIEYHAFQYCTGLTSVTIPNSVTEIGNEAFEGCTGLTEVNFNAEYCTYMGSMYYSVFEGCSNLKTINIGNNVKNIPSYAFYNCYNLTSISFPNSLIKIGDSAFEGCWRLTSITIPNSVTEIGIDAFNYTGWHDNHADGILYLDNCCLGYKGTIAGALTLNEGTRLIAGRAFYKCWDLTSITIPNSVTYIGSEAFYDCGNLTSVSIPNSVTEIRYGTFEYCSRLTSITIPNSVKKIEDRAFLSCEKLTEVNISDISSWCKIDFYDQFANPLYFAHHLFLNGKEIKNLVIPEDITQIKNYAFIDCIGLTSVTIPNSVTTIGELAFLGCSELTSVTVPNSVTTIGEDAFSYCSQLFSITIPQSVTEIGGGAFYNCSGLTSIDVESGNSKYDSRDNCNAIIETSTNTLIVGCQNTIIPNSVTEIGYGAFYNCIWLTSINIPNSVTSIGNEAFEGCNLETVTSYCETPPVCDYNAFYDSYSAILKVPEGTKDAYANAPEWKKFTNIQEIAGVEDVEVDNNAVETSRYDIHGRRLSEPAKGINIVKMSDGSTKKIMIKD